MISKSAFWRDIKVYQRAKQRFLDQDRSNSSTHYLDASHNFQNLFECVLKNEDNDYYENEDIEEDEGDENMIISCNFSTFLSILSFGLSENRDNYANKQDILKAFKNMIKIKLKSQKYDDIRSIVYSITEDIMNSSISVIILTPNLHNLFPLNIKNKYTISEWLAYLSISFFRDDSFVHDVLNCNEFNEMTERPDVWYSIDVYDVIEFINYFFAKISDKKKQQELFKKFGEQSIYVIMLKEILRLKLPLTSFVTQETIINSLENYKYYVVFRKIDKCQFSNFIDRIICMSDYKIKRKRDDSLSNIILIMMYYDLDKNEQVTLSWIKILKDRDCKKYFKDQTHVIENTTKDLSHEQKKAIDMMLNNSICVLQGKPGAGKSHTISKFALSIHQLNPLYKPFLLFLVPTRRAGLVVERMLKKNNMIPSYCYTIHKAYDVLKRAEQYIIKKMKEIDSSLTCFEDILAREDLYIFEKTMKELEWSQLDTDSYIGYIKNIFLIRLKEFYYHLLKREHQVTPLIIIIDESSMISWNHLEMVKQMEPTHLIMIGEEKQLPPVKQPRILCSITKILPNLTLREVHRYQQESILSKCIKYIEKANEYPTSSIKQLLNNVDKHCYDFLSSNITASYEYAISEHVKDLRNDVFSSIVLVYMNSTKDEMNQKIQDLFILNKEESFTILSSYNRSIVYFKNDKVVGIKNDYQYNIYNSENYIVEDISPHLIYAHENSQNVSYIRDASRMVQSFSEQQYCNRKLHYNVLMEKALHYFDKKFHIITDVAIRYLIYEGDKTNVTPQYLLDLNKDQDQDTNNTSRESKLLLIYYIFKDINEKIVKKVEWTKHLLITLRNEDNQKINVPIDIFTEKISLGYAITVHKAQGGEFKSCYICIIPNLKQQNPRFLRTAHSRAKEDCTYFTPCANENINHLIKKRFRTISYNKKDHDDYILQHNIGGLAIPRFFNMIIENQS